MNKTYRTGYYGIELVEDEHGFYLFASNGEEQSFDEKPTKEQIEQFIEEVTL